MSLLAASLLLLAQPAANIGLEPELRLLSHEEMSAALKDCGLKEVKVSYVAEYQSDVVEIDDLKVSEEQLRCSFWAVDHTPYIVFWSQDIEPRYYEIAQEFLLPRAQARARAYFTERGDLDSLPVRASDETDLGFAKRIESFCGPKAVGFFTDEYGGLVGSPDWILGGDFISQAETLNCLMQAAYLTGLDVGFIGNEKYAEETKEAKETRE